MNSATELMTASGPECVKTFFSAARIRNQTEIRVSTQNLCLLTCRYFRFNVDAPTSILAKRFYTLWADFCRS
ncbi:hypothetical protein D3C76_625850 [compost metagenome]|jgi:hypothetical protein